MSTTLFSAFSNFSSMSSLFRLRFDLVSLTFVFSFRYHHRVLYIDIDIHHGDGVEEAFYSTDRVMTLSFHKYGDFFPGTGDVRDTGVEEGKNYALNFPLHDGLDDESFMSIYEPIVGQIMEVYRPDAVVLQSGADSLTGDRLGCFNLSMRGHALPLRFLKKYNVPILLLGGGGYTIRNVARAWTYETAIALGEELPNDLPYNDYVDYYGPDYKLHVTTNNMANLNTPEYLEKHKQVILETLRHVRPPGMAPGRVSCHILFLFVCLLTNVSFSPLHSDRQTRLSMISTLMMRIRTCATASARVTSVWRTIRN
jgi:hypothetical protein